MKQYVASLSYGKDSLAMLHVITDVLHWQLDRIITADVWATDTIPADLPPMVEFKDKADRIIKERWGIEVEHFRADDSYENIFYRKFQRGQAVGRIYGFPFRAGNWCNGMLKMTAINKAHKLTKGCKAYIGIAVDEPNRFHNLDENTISPLVEANWTEAMCREWCEQNNLLSPIYTTAARGGVGSATIKALTNCAYFGRTTRICGRCFSNGIWTALLPSMLTGAPCMILTGVLPLRMPDTWHCKNASNGQTLMNHK